MRENYIEEISETGIKINICKSYKENKLSDIIKNVNEAIENLPEKILNYLIKNEFKIEVVSKRYINYMVELTYNGITIIDIITHIIYVIKKIILGNKRNGYYKWGKCCIYVSLDKDMDMKKVILHEIGHFIDYNGKFNINYKEYKEYKKKDNDFVKYKGDKNELLINKVSNPFRKSCNIQFLNIYNGEKDNYKEYKNGEYYKSKYSEHFAESFARYCMNSSEREKLSKDFNKTFQYIEKTIKDFKPKKIKK